MAALIVPIAAPGFNRPNMASQSHRSVQIIGAFKLLKGLLLIGLATGGIALLGKDVESTLTHLLKFVHADPGNHFIKTLLTKTVGLSPQLPLILIGSFIVSETPSAS